MGYLIDRVGMRSVVNRYNPTDKTDWMSQLSGGEKQRLAIVRALYDNPAFCIMDEATTAMLSDIEESIFKLLIERGITIISIVHKESLLRYHKKELRLLGNGEWKLDDIQRV
jgi:ABC-type uncharacterized transport system fused permease/ATPase subunit